MSILICVASDLPGGLDALIGPAFEESEVYNFLERSDDSTEFRFHSMRHECTGTACVDPIDLISRRGTSVLIVAKISSSFLIRFLDSGVRVFEGASGRVRDATEDFVQGRLREITK